MSHLFSQEFLEYLLLGLYALLMAVQGLFGWAVLKAFQPGKTPQVPHAGIYPGVSVVICARNEAIQLRQNLPGILQQQYAGKWEVIVVDDDSTDETQTVLATFEKMHPHLTLIKISPKQYPGKKQALAAGIAAARYTFLLFTDADTQPASQHWLRHMAETAVKHPATELVLGYGPLKSPSPPTFWSRWSQFEAAYTAMLYITFAKMGLPYMGVGRNLLVKKSLYERVGGFSKHLHIPSGDDDLLVNAGATRFNTTVCMHPDTFMFSEGKANFNSWLKQKKRHLGAGVAYRSIHQLLLGVLALSQTLHLFLGLGLFLAGIGPKCVVILWLLRGLLFWFVYRKAFKTLGEHEWLSRIPINDALLAVYYGAFVPLILIGKKTHSWK